MSNKDHHHTPANEDYPTVGQVKDTRIQSVKVSALVTPGTKQRLDQKSRATAVPVSEVLRRAIMLWIQDRLDLSEAVEGTTEIKAAKIATHLTPAAKRRFDQKSRLTAVPLTEVLRRAAVLWIQDRLDLSEAVDPESAA